MYEMQVEVNPSKRYFWKILSLKPY